MRVNLTDARKNFSKLIRAAERGEIVTICRRGVPVADLRATTAARKRPKLGTLRGKIKIFDPNWWKPMTDDEVEDFLAGRY
jgi:antitoxin (DNA-binding transcriptional repressor) of toxin-antitoxin stability system